MRGLNENGASYHVSCALKLERKRLWADCWRIRKLSILHPDSLDVRKWKVSSDSERYTALSYVIGENASP